MKTAYITALGLSLAACVTDVRTRRIPNLLTFGGAAAALIFHAITNGPGGFFTACAGWIIAVGFFFLPFALGGMGGGDVKLLGALGAWTGPAAAVTLALWTGAAGGVMALAVALVRGYLRQALRNIWLLLSHWSVSGIGPVKELSLESSRGPRLAYGVPILVGMVVTIWLNS